MFTKWALATTVLDHCNCYTLKWNTFTFTVKARCVLPKSGALHFYNRSQPLLSVHMTFLFSISGLVWMDTFPPSSTGWKTSVFIPIPKKGNAKECSNYCTIALISHATKVVLKILQARLQQYMNCELPDVQAGFRKGRGTRDQIAKFRWIIKKARVPEKKKNIYFCFIDYAKAFHCVNHNKLWKILKEMGIPDTWPAPWETYMQAGSNN